MQDIEGFSDCEALAQSERKFAPPSNAQDESTAGSPRGLDPRSILRSLNAVIYDWDIASDRLTWGANVGETLAGFPAASLATGAAFAELVTADSEFSRFQAINNASTRDEGEGAPYRIAYRLARADGASCAVEDFGRWFADARGRPARAHGVVRVLQRNGDAPFCAAEAPRSAREGALASRRNFNAALESRFSRTRPGEAVFAVLMVGVENLADLNRRYGYEVTDQVIEKVGRRLGGERARERRGRALRGRQVRGSPVHGKRRATGDGRAEAGAPGQRRTVRNRGRPRAGLDSHRRGACAPARPQRLPPSPACRRGLRTSRRRGPPLCALCAGPGAQRSATAGSRDRRRNRFGAEPAQNRARLSTRGRDPDGGRGLCRSAAARASGRRRPCRSRSPASGRRKSRTRRAARSACVGTGPRSTGGRTRSEDRRQYFRRHLALPRLDGSPEGGARRPVREPRSG